MRFDSLIKQMTLKEKVSLLRGGDFWHTTAIDRLGIPALMLCDGPHGLRKQRDDADHLGINESVEAVCFPAACATAASFEPALARQIGAAVAEACQAENVGVALGPAVNIKRSPLCGRNFEYFSEDPYLAARMGEALTEGLEQNGVAASVKHYAANSQEKRRMTSDSVVDERTMREIYLPAFEAAVKRGGASTVMCAYNRINGVYASENREYLTDILRGEWGFEGLVVSDWGAVSDRVKGVMAGLDLEMPSAGGVNDEKLINAVNEGKLDEADIDICVARVLNLVYSRVNKRDANAVWDKHRQHALARAIAAKCVVLLKNTGDILPLKRGESVAVIGEFARAPRYQGGGSSHINSFKVTSLMDALEGEPGVSYARGYDARGERADEELISEAVINARRANVAVIVAGLPDAFESEGYDRAHLSMPACQNELIARVAKANPNTVVVLYNGAPVVMPWLNDVKAVVEAYLGGQAVGGATKDVLYGIVNPGGRLPETFPLKIEDTPCYLSYGGEKDNAVYAEGVFVGYRYYDKKRMDVLFPFGYGLSYTSFEYTNLRVGKDSITDAEELDVRVDVTNVGARAGDEVVQLYVGDKESTVFRPVRELKAFTRITLMPGETRTVAFTLDSRAFAYWNAQIHDWHVESGEFNIEICRNSRDIALTQTVFVRGGKELPQTFTIDSTVGDIIENPRGKAVLAPIINSFMASFAPSKQDAAAAVSPDMAQALFFNAPLRNLLAFAPGAVSYEQLESLIAMLNA